VTVGNLTQPANGPLLGRHQLERRPGDDRRVERRDGLGHEDLHEDGVLGVGPDARAGRRVTVGRRVPGEMGVKNVRVVVIGLVAVHVGVDERRAERRHLHGSRDAERDEDPDHLVIVW